MTSTHDQPPGAEHGPLRPPEFAATEQPDAEPSNSERADGGRPRIYVASLTDMERGIAHGVWIDADQPDDALPTAIRRMLDESPTGLVRGSPVYDWAVFDARGFGQATIDMKPDLTHVARLARGIAKHGAAFGFWFDHVGPDNTRAHERFTKAFRGEYESIEDFASTVFGERTGLLPIIAALDEDLREYVEINWHEMGLDLWESGKYLMPDTPDGKVWIFEKSIADGAAS